MSAAVPAGSAAIRTRARRLRVQAASLRFDAAAKRQRTNELTERLARSLLSCGDRAFGDHGDDFRLRLGRLRPLVRLARHDLRRWLETAGLPPAIVDDVALACSEAYANAVEHPTRPTRHAIEIVAHHDPLLLELRIRDYGSWTAHTHSEQRGRGLAMIRTLMDSLEIQRTAAGTELVMRRALAPADTRPAT